MKKIIGFVRKLWTAIRSGSWQFADELEMEREIFPRAYAVRKKLEERR